jgi:hypothetical protein
VILVIEFWIRCIMAYTVDGGREWSYNLGYICILFLLWGINSDVFQLWNQTWFDSECLCSPVAMMCYVHEWRLEGCQLPIISSRLRNCKYLKYSQKSAGSHPPTIASPSYTSHAADVMNPSLNFCSSS